MPLINPDDFVSYKDYEKIDSCAVEIADSWWKTQDLEVTYNDINLGEMVEWELTLTLIRFVKELYAIDSILQACVPELVLSSKGKTALSMIPEYLCAQRGIQFLHANLSEATGNGSFKMDLIPVSFNFAGRVVTLNLSRKFFFRLKEIGESAGMIIYRVFRATKFYKGRPNILLLDFNPSTYYEMLKQLAETKYNVFMVNSRRPAIWNTDSLKVMRKLGFNILLLKEYPFDEVASTVTLERALLSIERCDKLQRIFQISGIRFWHLIQDEFKEFCRSRFSEILQFIDRGNSIITANRLDLILAWTDALQFEKTILKLAAKNGINSIMIQHGIHGLIRDPERSWHQFDIAKLYADKMLVYGEVPKKYLQHSGIPEKKIEIIGSPRHDLLFNTSGMESTNSIMLATSGVPTAYSYFLSNIFLTTYEANLRAICKAASTMKDKEFIVKLHPFADEMIDVISMVKEEAPEAHILKNADTYKLLRECGVVISTESTVIMEALILDKPAIVIEFLKRGESVPFIESGAALGVWKPEDAYPALRAALFDEGVRERLRAGRSRFLKEYLSFHGNASKQLLSFLPN